MTDSIQEQLLFLRSLMWINDFDKMMFTIRRTNNPDREEYYWFSFNIATGTRKHHIYYADDKAVYISYEKCVFTFRLLRGNLYQMGYKIIQLSDIADVHNYINYMGIGIPVTKNPTPYIIN